MKVQFLSGYRGWATNEQYYASGEVGEFETEIAKYLERVGRVVVLDEVEATPQAVELAAQHGINLNAVAGSGADGRILVGDVKEAIDANA